MSLRLLAAGVGGVLLLLWLAWPRLQPAPVAPCADAVRPGGTSPREITCRPISVPHPASGPAPGPRTPSPAVDPNGTAPSPSLTLASAASKSARPDVSLALGAADSDPGASPVSMVVLRYPTMLPDTWLYPNRFPCSVPCVVHYNNTWIEGYRQNQHWLNHSQVLVVYSAMPAAYPEPAWYDLAANPRALTLMMLNWENWRRRDIVPARWKAHWWLYRLCQDPGTWRRFPLVSSVERGSLVPFSYHQQYKLYVNLLLGRPPEGELPEWPSGKRQDAWISLMAHHPGYGYDRLGLVKALMRHLPVHSYGRLLRNMKVRGDGHFNVLSSLRLIARYRFHLALENSVAPDYVTEKVYLALFAGTVPIYAGAPNVGLFVPPQSVILVDAFPSVAALVKYLRCVVSKPEVYAFYRGWRNRTSPEWAAWRAMPHPLCQACNMVARRDPRLRNASLRIPPQRDVRAEVLRSHTLQAPLRACL